MFPSSGWSLGCWGQEMERWGGEVSGARHQKSMYISYRSQHCAVLLARWLCTACLLLASRQLTHLQGTALAGSTVLAAAVRRAVLLLHAETHSCMVAMLQTMDRLAAVFSTGLSVAAPHLHCA